MSGLSISLRERDDVIQIWNTQSSLADQARILHRIHELLPNVKFLAEFYKGNLASNLSYVTASQNDMSRPDIHSSLP